jgi:tetratricopeptide (TPR) repeat protein
MVDPRRIRTRDEWTAALRKLFNRAGLSYHVLSERCGGTATSTLQQMVTGQSVPRASTVRLFVRACGESDPQPWVDARNRVKASDDTMSRAPTPQAGPRQAKAGKDPVIRTDPRHVLDYAQTVSRFAPPVLRDREAELAELREFCLRPSGESYCYLRGTAWAGKTALLATFVLTPLMSEVTFVAFFVRAGDQDDYQDFLRVVTRQLGVFLRENPPSDPSRADLDSMLGKAAEQCRREGRRLVLVVDGLDEDYYANKTKPRRRPSIASLLPERPPDGTRVIVSGRPDPPVDVPECHPLLDPGVVRELAPSKHAELSERRAKRDLTDMLEDSPLSRQLLGLVVAAETGLSVRCLVELAREDEWEVERCLGAVSGRVLHRLDTDSWTAPDRDGSYQLAHTDLRELARNLLGKSLVQHRQRIFVWAEEYRQLGWPSQTPEYLLRGYFRMLDDLGDLPQMIECATDLARQDRMRDLSGGDAAALTEIITTQDVIVTQDDPDLIAMVRLAIHRDHLTAQNHNIPFNLPPVWALLGEVNRAEATARPTLDQHGWDRQADVLASVAKATAETGDLDRAETTARSITKPFAQAEAVVSVAEAAIEAGDIGRAAALIDHAQAIGASIHDPSSKALTLELIAEVAAKAGDLGRAATLIDQAEASIHSITDDSSAPPALLRLVEAMAKVGDLDRAEAMARAITTKFGDRDKALMSVAEALLKTDDVGRADTIVNSITDPYWRTRALASAAGVAADAGDLGRAATSIMAAEAAAGSISKLESQAWSLCSVAEAAAKAGDLRRAATLIDRAEANARCIDARSSLMLDQQARVLVSVAETAAKTGDLDRAETITRSITVLKLQAWALASVAEVVAKVGHLEQARALLVRAEAVARIPDPLDQQKVVRGLGSLAEAAVGAGDLDGAASLVIRAEAIARSIRPAVDRNVALALAAEAAAKAGGLDRANTITGSIPDPYWRAQALMWIGEATARAGDFDQAGTLLGRAKTMARHSERNDFQRARSLESSIDSAARAAELSRAEAAAKADDLDRAESIAGSVRYTTHEEQARVLVSMADAAAKAGDLERVGSLIARAEAIADSIHIGRTRPGPVGRSHRDAFERERVVRTLTLLTEAVAKTGDVDLAGSLIVRAEAIADSITGSDHRARALVSVAEAAVEANDHDGARSLIVRARAIADSITNPYSRATVLVSIADAAAKSHDFDRAEAIADSIGSAITPKEQAQAFLALTASHDPRRRARAVARALRITDWHLPIQHLINIAPEALPIVIAEIDTGTRSDAS